MTSTPKAPKSYDDFTQRFPGLAEAWEKTAVAGKEGPLDEKTARLVKLGIAIGAMLHGPVHASIRKALAMGITREELEQVVALSAGTIGFPSAVAAYNWLRDLAD